MLFLIVIFVANALETDAVATFSRFKVYIDSLSNPRVLRGCIAVPQAILHLVFCLEAASLCHSVACIFWQDWNSNDVCEPEVLQ